MGGPKDDWSPTRPQKKSPPPRKTAHEIKKEAAWKRKMRFIDQYNWKPPTDEELRKAGLLNDADKSKRLKALQERIDLQIQVYLTQWKNEVDSAIDQAPAPQESKGRFEFYLALAGNLLWAATAFIGPGLVGKIVTGSTGLLMGEKATEKVTARIVQTMSVTGATAGSNTLGEFFPNKSTSSLTAEDGKDLVRTVAGLEMTELMDIYREASIQWAKDMDDTIFEFVGKDADRLRLFEQKVWEHMFPRIPFDHHRLNEIRERCKKKVALFLIDFRAQWNKFQQDLMAPSSVNTAYALYAMGTLALRETTFKPKMNISLADD